MIEHWKSDFLWWWHYEYGKTTAVVVVTMTVAAPALAYMGWTLGTWLCGP